MEIVIDPMYKTIEHIMSAPVSVLSRHVKNRIAAARAWNDVVIPRLIRPYLDYIRLSSNGSVVMTLDQGQYSDCTCQSQSPLTLDMLRWDGM